jgi:hypothetical protein
MWLLFDNKQKVLFGCAVAIFTFAGAATVALINRKPDLKALPADMQNKVPLQAPFLIEDDAGVPIE